MKADHNNMSTKRNVCLININCIIVSIYVDYSHTFYLFNFDVFENSICDSETMNVYKTLTGSNFNLLCNV